MERRQMTRYDFGAIAEVVDLNSREDVVVVTRDLSLAGCFVKTRYPECSDRMRGICPPP